jgi:hypothetical protein
MCKETDDRNTSVCIVSVLRLVKLIDVETTPPIDASYTSAELSFWTVVEVNTAISCACVMTLKPLIVHFYPRFLAPSTYMSDPTLQRVTARSRRSSGRSSWQSSARLDSRSTRQGHQMSEIQSPRRCMFPRIDENDTGLSEDGFKTPDIESQRVDSVASTIPDEDATFGGGTLSAPPKPRLRPST